MRVLFVLGPVFWLAWAVAQGQAPPVEYITFRSHGRPVSCAVYNPGDAMATIIVLDAPAEAQFFAGHGFRVLVPDYVSAAASREPTAANFRRWAQVVDDMLDDPSLPRNRKIGLAGLNLGASVALVVD